MTAAVPKLLEVSDLGRRVEEQLIRFFADRNPFSTSGCSETTLLEPLVDLLLGGGKRLRAAFCYWGWRGAGGEDCDGAVAAAASLELLHGCALIHDDVMDRSSLRRGRPTVHHRLAAVHVARGWRGPPEEFGMAAAILAGDLCLVWADELLRDSGLPMECLQRAGSVFDAMREEIIRGQYLDLVTQAVGALRVEDAWRVAEAKTAASTTSGPLEFGAVLAGAGAGLRESYAAYADPLGVAFQLRDDLLGAFGDPALTGKPSGDDLRDGKCTVLLAQAHRLGGPSIGRRIDDLLRDRSGGTVAELRRIIEETGARANVEKLISDLGEQAVAALEAAPMIDEEPRWVLRGLARALTDDGRSA